MRLPQQRTERNLADDMVDNDSDEDLMSTRPDSVQIVIMSAGARRRNAVSAEMTVDKRLPYQN